MLWQALGHEPPVWAHVPVLVNEQRKKLSKRRDKVALEQYRDEGYLAEAMVNYLMTLGWAPTGDTEIVPWREIEDEFRLEDVNHSPAFFDLKKLAAFNGEYIRALPVDEFIARVRAVAARRTATGRCSPRWRRSCRPGSSRSPRCPPMVDFLFLDEPEIDAASWTKVMAPRVRGAAARRDIAAYDGRAWDADALKRALEEIGDALRAEAGQGAGAGAGGRHRAHRRPAAVRVAGGARPRRDAAPAASGARSG